MPENTLYYGDNLKVMREHMKDESVDLVYLDPPFNSNANYNVLFAEKDGTQAASQIQAFGDTWHWNEISSRAYTEAVESGGKVSEALRAFHGFLGGSDMLAYLSMMAPRLIEMRRIMRQKASIFLHCDDTASHYLKQLMDAIFGPANFVNEVIWQRSQTRSSISRAFRRAHDVIFLYGKSKDRGFNMQFRPLSAGSLKLYDDEDEKGKFQGVPLLVSGKRNGETGQLWHGIDPNLRGKAGMHWLTKPSNLDKYEKDGLILWPEKKNGMPRLKYYLEQSPGVPLNDIWNDIPLISASAAESLGYPTQKPEALLDRIIQAGSNKGQIVFDPFCGCGTSIASAQRLDRKWIGIDITHLAINLIKYRLHTAHEGRADKSYETIGEPEDLAGAKQLAGEAPYQFQWWALSLVHARPADQKKGADRGIDGRLYFHDRSATPTAPDTKQVIFSVKAGHTNVAHVRDLLGVLQREKAQIGVMLTLQEPTQPMRQEAASAGFYKAPTGEKFARIQFLTVEQLLAGERVEMPHAVHLTFKGAPKARVPQSRAGELFGPENSG